MRRRRFLQGILAGAAALGLGWPFGAGPAARPTIAHVGVRAKTVGLGGRKLVGFRATNLSDRAVRLMLRDATGGRRDIFTLAPYGEIVHAIPGEPGMVDLLVEHNNWNVEAQHHDGPGYVPALELVYLEPDGRTTTDRIAESWTWSKPLDMAGAGA